jgi:hypothetical protein
MANARKSPLCWIHVRTPAVARLDVALPATAAVDVNVLPLLLRLENRSLTSSALPAPPQAGRGDDRLLDLAVPQQDVILERLRDGRIRIQAGDPDRGGQKVREQVGLPDRERAR